MEKNFGIALILAAILAGCLQSQVEMKSNEVNWVLDYSKGLEVAKKENKPVLLYFWASWCPWCKKMDSEILTDNNVVRMILNNLVPVKIDIDAKENQELLRKYNFRGTPTFIIVGSDGKILLNGNGEIGYLVGYRKSEDFLQFLDTFAKK